MATGWSMTHSKGAATRPGVSAQPMKPTSGSPDQGIKNQPADDFAEENPGAGHGPVNQKRPKVALPLVVDLEPAEHGAEDDAEKTGLHAKKGGNQRLQQIPRNKLVPPSIMYFISSRKS